MTTAIDLNKTKEEYLAWLDEELAKDTATFPKFRKLSRYRIPLSTRRLGRYKKLLIEVFGEGCHICGYVGPKMVLAHLYYMPDSVLADESDGRGHLHRVCEALEFPERFVRLCQLCHDIFDHARRNGNYSYLMRIARLIKISKELEVLQCQ